MSLLKWLPELFPGNGLNRGKRAGQEIHSIKNLVSVHAAHIFLWTCHIPVVDSNSQSSPDDLCHDPTPPPTPTQLFKNSPGVVIGETKEDTAELWITELEAGEVWLTGEEKRNRNGKLMFLQPSYHFIKPHMCYISLQAGTCVVHPCIPATRTVSGTPWTLSKHWWASGYNPCTAACTGHRNTEAWSYIIHSGKKENPFISTCCARCAWIQRHRCLVIAMIFISWSEDRFSQIGVKLSELGPKPPSHHGQEQLYF